MQRDEDIAGQGLQSLYYSTTTSCVAGAERSRGRCLCQHSLLVLLPSALVFGTVCDALILTMIIDYPDTAGGRREKGLTRGVPDRERLLPL